MKNRTATAIPISASQFRLIKKGYSLFAASHLPERVTAFGMEKRNQDIYNAVILSDILGKTAITRTFEEVSCKDIKQIHQVLLMFPY